MTDMNQGKSSWVKKEKVKAINIYKIDAGFVSDWLSWTRENGSQVSK